MSRPRDWDAATYDRVADPMTRWGAGVLDRLPLRGDERVLDAGCGSGRVTELLAERLPRGSRRRARRLAGDGRAGPRSARPLRRSGRATSSPISASRSRSPSRSTRSSRRRRSTGSPTTTRSSGTSPPSSGRAGASSPSAAAPATSRIVQRVLAAIGDGWLGDVHFETPEATTSRLDGGRLRRRRVLADRRADVDRAGRAVRGVPPDRRPRLAPRPAPGVRARRASSARSRRRCPRPGSTTSASTSSPAAPADRPPPVVDRPVPEPSCRPILHPVAIRTPWRLPSRRPRRLGNRARPGRGCVVRGVDPSGVSAAVRHSQDERMAEGEGARRRPRSTVRPLSASRNGSPWPGMTMSAAARTRSRWKSSIVVVRGNTGR